MMINNANYQSNITLEFCLRCEARAALQTAQMAVFPQMVNNKTRRVAYLITPRPTGNRRLVMNRRNFLQAAIGDGIDAVIPQETRDYSPSASDWFLSV